MAIFNVPQMFQDAGVLDLREGATGGSLNGWEFSDGVLSTVGPVNFYRAYQFANELSPQPWVRSTDGFGVDMTGVVESGELIRYRVSGSVTADPNITYIKIGDAYIDASTFIEADGKYYFASSFEDDVNENRKVSDPAAFNPNPVFGIGYFGATATLEVEITIEAETVEASAPTYRYGARWESYVLETGTACDWDFTIEDIQVNTVRVQLYKDRRGQVYTEGYCDNHTLVLPFSDAPVIDRFIGPDEYYFNNQQDNWYITNIFVPEAEESDLIVVTLAVVVTTDRGVYDSEMQAYLRWTT